MEKGGAQAPLMLLLRGGPRVGEVKKSKLKILNTTFK